MDLSHDIALLSSKFNDIQDKATASKEWAETGLTINISKTMKVRLNAKIDRPIMINGQELEEVDEFAYLGFN